MYLKRVIEEEVIAMAKQYPVITITGPRQSGKTTGQTHYDINNSMLINK
jgi:predicted AAA+ superfamily ATPase